MTAPARSFRLAITPGVAYLAPGEAIRFMASGGIAPVTWRLEGPGSLDPDGGYLAPLGVSQIARGMVTATANGDTASASVVVHGAPPSAIECVGAGQTHLPALGEFVYVQVLPEPLFKVAPVYPDAAREAGIQGTVMVHALICKNGQVLDAQVQRSVPGLDEAAITAVRQWYFAPATVAGEPVACWMAIPVRFTLH